jgi:acetyl-CoA synthetase
LSEVKDILPVDQRFHPSIQILRETHAKSFENPDAFWRSVAEELFWYQKTGAVFESTDEPPFGRWFPKWETNLSYNCLDRHVKSWRKNKVAFYWEGENGDKRILTYYDLHKEVNKFAWVLQQLGVKKKDRITIYLPMIPELPICMLAALRIGALHSVIFSGFSAHSVAERINDSASKVVVTADGFYRRGRFIELKQVVDEALKETGTVEKVIVIKRAGKEVAMVEDRDVWYDEIPKPAGATVEPERLEGTHPSYILYTSGTTGTPKGVVHSTAGYMVWLYYTQKAVFDIQDEDIYWCTGDIGWVTGHSYVVYGPLLRGITSLLYEGALDFPVPDRWWEMIERYGITILYSTPTSIRMHMKFGDEWVKKHDLSSLRLLGSVGEPINPEAWQWYYRNVGSQRCAIVDTWWQTETGGIMVSPQPGIAHIPLKSGSATLPLPGVDCDVVTEAGKSARPNEKGFMVIKKPWPGELLTIWENPKRFREAYFRKFPGMYLASDFAMKDEDGYFWFLGRADEVLKIAGHRISTTELEDVLIAHPAVAESAVIGKADPIKFQVPVAFVTLRPDAKASPQLRVELINHVRHNLGSIAAPETVYFVSKLPKTRSGKIMRRLLGAIVEERALGDITTLEDGTSVDEARRSFEELRAELKEVLAKN